MTVKFSRHAKRRAKLYTIPEAVIRKILESMDLKKGEYEFVEDISNFKFPIKIIVSVGKNIATVITNYPLKKGRRK